MAVDWRETIKVLLPQFQRLSEKPFGLHHVLVESADDERDKLSGPNWIQIEKPEIRFTNGQPEFGRWAVSGFTTFPSDGPTFRAAMPDETFCEDDTRVVRDRSGKVQAVFVPMRLRCGYYSGCPSDEVKKFEACASVAVNAMLGSKDLAAHFLGADLVEALKPPIGGIRYVFGEVGDVPSDFSANGWQAGVLQYENGVLIDLPLGGSQPNANNWVLMLHRLGWRKYAGSGLRAHKAAWGDNVEIEWENLSHDWSHLPPALKKRLDSVSRKSFYSVLGSKDAPLDLNLASVFAIQLLLSELTSKLPNSSFRSTDQAVDYANEPWFLEQLPIVRPIERADLDPEAMTKIGVLVATPTERDAVLKFMRPPRGKKFIIQVFVGNNTYYFGRLGACKVALCMTSMGSIGRDSSLNVTGEFIDEWNLKAVIMLGIAFGKDSSKQSIGQILVSDRIIAYEPTRMGATEAVSRGQEPSASPLLLNRFRNVINWHFASPNGKICDLQIGPLLSGEKLVDNPEFKDQLFKQHPTAIGGEMEGAGFASAAERKKCDWIVIKAICDWGDGTKEKQHQAFAAAASVSLAIHVFNQVGAMSQYDSK
jgi:nucleoside phosphorylase